MTWNGKMDVMSELGKMWKETLMSCFKISQNFSVKIKEKYKII